MVHQRRHAPVSRPHRTQRSAPARSRSAQHGPFARFQRGAEGVFAQDHGDRRRGGKFRWFVSTCFAAGIGTFAILFALLGANDDGSTNSIGGPMIGGRTPDALAMASLPAPEPRQGLIWALPKGNKLVVTSGALSTKFIIHDQIHLQKDKRDYLQKKAYVRIVAHLAAAPAATESDNLPPFNPYTLYSDNSGGTDTDALADVEQQDVHPRLVDVLGGVLPNDDGQDMNLPEVAEVVARDAAQDDVVTLKPGFQASGEEKLSGGAQLQRRKRLPETLPPNTTALAKTPVDGDEDEDDLEAHEVRTVKIERNDRLSQVLSRLNTEQWQIDEIKLAASGVTSDLALTAGQEVQVTLAPSLTKKAVNDISKVSVYSDSHELKLTVIRRADGEFAKTTNPADARDTRLVGDGNGAASTATLYSSLFMAATAQGLAPEVITQILKIHASETDFRRRVRAADSIELFFDVKDGDGPGEGALGDLLATTLTVGGETQRYVRFRMPDGSVDFYDAFGNNSRKFLMRKPVRGEVRLADGFGFRMHPVLHILRRHAGIDWAGPAGTPIMAAGNGVIEEQARKGEFGNYIRIRHANGYSTAYAHMSKFATGLAKGSHVTQGQVIGFIGTTGLSTGAHLHFEILINNQQVDPMKLPVPKERKLTGKDLADFQKERLRIEELMRRNPVSTQMVEARNAK